jgi:2-polyprenyl-3-methyl-5-hydroxy-6-metoxy-1,4-benzoquinol methylase
MDRSSGDKVGEPSRRLEVMRRRIMAANVACTESAIDDFVLERYEQMIKHVPSQATRVLDVGCHTGRGGVVVKKLRPDVELTGFDCIPERIAALDPSTYHTGICGWANEIPADDGSYDAIISGEFIEHVPPRDIDDTLAEFFRVLTLHGRLVMTTPNPNYLKNKLFGLSVLTEDSHITQHYPNSMRQRLRTIGYSHVRIVGTGRMTRYIGSHVPFLPVYGAYLVHADKW